MRLLTLVCVVLGLACSAQALIIESESNNTLGTADEIVVGARPWNDLGAIAMDGTGGDVDYFLLSLELNDVLAVESTPVQPMFSIPDTRLGLFDAGGTLLLADVNSPAAGASSNLLYPITATGIYYLAVTGGTDLDFSGNHGQAGPYLLDVTVTPEPASLAFLGLGMLACLRRRR